MKFNWNTGDDDDARARARARQSSPIFWASGIQFRSSADYAYAMESIYPWGKLNNIQSEVASSATVCVISAYMAD